MDETFDPYHTWLGIPPEQQPPDHYRLLGIRAFETNPDVIENAADRQMAHLRTFQSGRHSVLSQKLLNEVAAAKVCLLNTEKQAAYDQKLRQQMQPPQAEPELDGLFQQAAPTNVRRATRVAKKSRSSLALYLGVVAVVAVVVAVLVSRPSGETPIAGTPPSNDNPHSPQAVGRSPDVRKPSPPNAHKQAVGRTQQVEPDIAGIQTADVAVHSPGGQYAPLVVGEFVTNFHRYYWHAVPTFAEEEDLLFWQPDSAVGITTFEVLTDGPVLMACTTRWGGGGNPSGGWMDELTTREELEDEGWTEFAIGLSDTRDGVPPPTLEYIVFRRDSVAGEVFTYRTEKYRAPLIIRSETVIPKPIPVARN